MMPKKTGVILLVKKKGFTSSQIHYGYMENPALGVLNKVPYWGNSYSYLYSLVSDILIDTGRYRTTFHILESDALSVRVTIPKNGMSFTKQAGESDTQEYSNALRFNELVGQEVELVFDPPPRRLLGSRNIRTNLGIGYYVEEVPWEAQDAEQGTPDDGRRRGVVDSTIKFHRGLLYRSNPVGLNRSDAYPLGRKSEHGYCNDSNTSKEYPTTYTKCRTLQGHNRRWVYSRRLRQTRNSNHSESKRGVSRGALQSVISKEALYA